jgi:spore maturation protein CgeB
VRAFTKAKHEIFTYDLARLRGEYLFSSIEEFTPDLIFTLHGLNIPSSWVEKMKDRGYKTALWLVDDPYEVDASITYAPAYDYIINTEESGAALFRGLGHSNVMHCHLGVDEEVYYSAEVTGQYRSEICIIGSAFENRLQLVDAIAPFLRRHRVRIIGPGWEKLRSYALLKDFIRNEIIPPEEVAKYYNGAKINLTINRSDQYPIARQNQANIRALSPTNRIFEIGMCNGLHLTDIMEETPKLYALGKEIVVYEGIEDLKEKVTYFLQREGNRRKISAACQERTRKEHLYTKRIEKIADWIFQGEKQFWQKPYVLRVLGKKDFSLLSHLGGGKKSVIYLCHTGTPVGESLRKEYVIEAYFLEAGKDKNTGVPLYFYRAEQAPPFQEKCADVLVFDRVLEEAVEGAKLIEKFLPCLKPSGKVVICTYNHGYLPFIEQLVNDKRDGEEMKVFKRHRYFLTKGEILELVKEWNLKVENFIGFTGSDGSEASLQKVFAERGLELPSLRGDARIREFCLTCGRGEEN